MKLLLILLVLSHLHCLGQNNNVIVLDSLPIPFKDKLFSNIPLIQKKNDKFFIYDFVSERLLIADINLNPLKDAILSPGKALLVNSSKEVKLLYRNMYVGEKTIYLLSSSIDRYSYELFKQPRHKLSYKSPNDSFRTIAVPDVGFLVQESNKKNYYLVRIYTPATKSNLVDVCNKDFYQRPMYAIFEKNMVDTAYTSIERMIIPHDKIYQEKLPLGYTYMQTITFGKKGHLITTEGASEKIRIYNIEGKEIEVLGEKGKYMTKNDTFPYLFYTQDTSRGFLQKVEKFMERNAFRNPVYGQAYYDAQSDKIYREYSPSVVEEERRRRYMQIYQKKKLRTDIPFPTEYRIISIENNIIWTYKVNPDGETPPQFIYKLKILGI